MNHLIGVIKGNTISVINSTTLEIKFRDGEVWYALLDINNEWHYERKPEIKHSVQKI